MENRNKGDVIRAWYQLVNQHQADGYGIVKFKN